MKFRNAHKGATYLLATTAAAAVTTSGALPATAVALVFSAIVLSWFADPETRLGEALSARVMWMNIGAVLFFAFSLFQVVRTFPQPDLTPIVNLVLFLLSYKLFIRRTNRDHLQIFVLSFLLVLAGAWLADSALFAIWFTLFTIFTTWTLVLFHLRREIEENYIIRHAADAQTRRITAARVLNSTRVVGPVFFGYAALLSICMVAGAVLLFLTIPRVGVGYLSGACAATPAWRDFQTRSPWVTTA